MILNQQDADQRVSPRLVYGNTTLLKTIKESRLCEAVDNLKCKTPHLCCISYVRLFYTMHFFRNNIGLKWPYCVSQAFLCFELRSESWGAAENKSLTKISHNAWHASTVETRLQVASRELTVGNPDDFCITPQEKITKNLITNEEENCKTRKNWRRDVTILMHYDCME